MITKESISNFFKGKSKLGEAQQIAAYLDESPDEISKIEFEWNRFSTSQSLPMETSAKLWLAIESETFQKRKYSLSLKQMMLAASTLLIVALGCYLYYFSDRKNMDHTESTAAVKELKQVSNTAKHTITVTLTDISTVQLSPHSTISFPEKFDSLQRNIFLEGEGRFNVTENKHSPFTVFCGLVSATVLGTEFSIRAFPSEKEIKIILYEGRIRINSINNKKYYLAPGDQFIYNKTTQKEKVIRAAKPRPASPPQLPAAPSKKEISMEGDNWYMFNNQSLESVFDQLEIIYGTKIIYDKNEVRGKTFIGKIDKSDSLETILRSIALLNNLHFETSNHTYRIRK